MTPSLYFYDLETSGVNPREDRIMQFAGQRTDLDLKSVGEPHDVLIKLTDDILPDPYAVLIHGITPQRTIQEGLTEAEFLKIFETEIATPGTIFVGFNNVRFDDEFIRYLNYRNFYDPYEWHWQDSRGRWDLLDVVRMTRALRPDGIQWPFGADGKPSNRLELLTGVNKLEHADAHTALSDVRASLSVAQLLRDKQPKLFDFLLNLRDKRAVEKLVRAGGPFVYTSGKYPSEFEKTTIVAVIADHPKKQGVLVYDLRHDPKDFAGMQPEQIVECWKWSKDKQALDLPVKTLQFNRCPAVAPLNVLDDSSQKRLQLDPKKIEQHRQELLKHPEFVDNVLKALSQMDQARQSSLLSEEQLVDAQLYDGFMNDSDKPTLAQLRASDPIKLDDFTDKLKDSRLQSLLPLYKARNYPAALTSAEQLSWERYRAHKLLHGGSSSRAGQFFTKIEQLKGEKHLTKNELYLLDELKLYAESILPEA